MGMPGLDLAEDIVNRHLRQQAGRVAEMLGRSRFRERPERPEEGHAQRLLQRQAGRHHFTEEEGDVVTVQRARIGILQPAQHLRLALRPVDEAGVTEFGLDLTDLLRTTGTLIEQAQQFTIDAVNVGADAGQRLLQIGLRLVAHRINPCVWQNRS